MIIKIWSFDAANVGNSGTNIETVNFFSLKVFLNEQIPQLDFVWKFWAQMEQFSPVLIIACFYWI